MKTPVLFVSHGSPDIILQQTSPTLKLWEQLGHHIAKPTAIVMISAHWETHAPAVTSTAQPSTIYDFGGFPAALYQLTYPALGSPDLAQRLTDLLAEQQIVVSLNAQRGLDHGAWIPLSIMYPNADIPVIQLSIQTHAGSRWHLRLGQALQALRDENILIIASGAVTHNFAWLSRSAEPLAKVVEFSDWLAENLQKRADDALVAYRQQAPYGAAAHPTEEHLLPLWVAYGASSAEDQLTRFQPEITYGALAMDAYLWEAQK